MFATLVESRPTRERRRGGTVLSIAVHTAVISLAVYATANASLRRTHDVSQPIITFVPTPSPKPVRPPPAANPIIDGPPSSVFNPPIDVPTTIPSVDVTKSAVDSDFWSRRAAGLTESPKGNIASPRSDQPFRAVEVEKPAAAAPGSAQPAYPPMLAESGITGHVVAQFVVDTLGRVEAGSFRIQQSDNSLFDDAVKAAVPRMRFYPAEVGGQRVRQLVEQAFTFELRR